MLSTNPNHLRPWLQATSVPLVAFPQSCHKHCSHGSGRGRLLRRSRRLRSFVLVHRWRISGCCQVCSTWPSPPSRWTTSPRCRTWTKTNWSSMLLEKISFYTGNLKMEISATTLQIRLGFIWRNHGIKTESSSESSNRKKYLRIFFLQSVKSLSILSHCFT